MSIKSTTDLTSAAPFLDDQAPEPDVDDVDDDFMSGLRAATGVGKRKAKLVSSLFTVASSVDSGAPADPGLLPAHHPEEARPPPAIAITRSAGPTR